LHKHFPFQHVDQHAFRMRGTAALHALRKIFRALPRQASQRVLRKIARHVSSRCGIAFTSISHRVLVRTVPPGSSLPTSKSSRHRVFFFARHTTLMEVSCIWIDKAVTSPRSDPMTKIVHALYVCLLVSDFSQAQTKLKNIP